ncbi:MAG: hypothetical protein AAFY57_12685 [Cyanobacteria bacterium J06642_2]
MALSSESLGKSRPLWQVLLLSGATLLLYYGWYKWIVQEELRHYTGSGWSGTLCLTPFVLGVAAPQLAYFFSDAPGWVRWLSLIGVVWIYIVQYRLYRDVNRLYTDLGKPEPLTVWWLVVPGLNLVVGLRQIHFLSQFWALQSGRAARDPLANFFPWLFAEPTST